MATRTSNLAPSNNTDTLFRAWINEIHNALIAFGWTQASDTGQINFSTITRPIAINTYQGFAIYAMGDALQATTAVYLRIEFGTGGIADTPSVKVSIGIGGTNGSGTLTGNVTTSTLFVTNPADSAASSTTALCRCSGTSSAFRMMFWAGAGAGLAHGWFIAIERDKDTLGIDTTNGVVLAICYTLNNIGTSLGLGTWYLDALGGSELDSSRLYAMLPGATQTTTQGSVTCVAPVRAPYGRFRNPMTGMVMFYRPDFNNESQCLAVVSGLSHNYLFLRLGPNTASANSWNNDCGLALLWE